MGSPLAPFLLSRQTKSVSSVDELVRLVDQSGELAGYVALSTGSQAAALARRYDQARAQLCRSESLLTRAAGATPCHTRQDAPTYVQKTAADVVSQAEKRSRLSTAH
jgi:hypothetical protein